MADERHTAAFVVGAIIGGIAGVAAVLWTTPKSGAQLRAELTGAVDSARQRATEVGERSREAISAVSPLSPKGAPETATVTATAPAGDVVVPAAPESQPETAGPAVFPPLVDFAPPGVDVEPATDPEQPAPPA